jgi:hypothetical protein
MVRENPIALAYIPDEQITPDLGIVVVNQDGTLLRYVPTPLITPEICLAAVHQNGRALQHVPLHLRTPALCMVAVQQDGRALYDVPPNLKTPAVCIAALRQNRGARQFIPAHLMSEINATLSSRSATIANFKPRRSAYETNGIPVSDSYRYSHNIYNEIGESKQLPKKVIKQMMRYGINPVIHKGVHVPDPSFPEEVEQHLRSFYIPKSEVREIARKNVQARLSKVNTTLSKRLPDDAIKRIQSYYGGKTRKNK